MDPRSTIAAIAARHPGLELLVLHGSRARGEAVETSDWDFAFLADDQFRPEALFAQLDRALHTDRVDLVDLRRAGGLLRFRVAREGVVLFERAPGIFEDLALDAIRFWLDAGPVIDRAYHAVLEDLGR